MNKEKTIYRQQFQESYKKLNRHQKEAVDTIEGPVTVIAGPGTGKTQILTLRIANIIDKLGADLADNILALTFTNTGVQAMRDRLSQFVGPDLAYQVNIFTFHSFAEDQIKKYPEYFSRFNVARPVTEIQQIKIIEKILKKHHLEYLKTFASDFHYTKEIITAIDDLKREAISPEEFRKSLPNIRERILAEEGENAFLRRRSGNRQKGDLKKSVEQKIFREEGKQKELAKIYSEYQEALQKSGLYDFSDMILTVVEEAEKNPEYLTVLQEQYQYILVDEHQDTNQAQNRMIELIASAAVNEYRPNIFTVGDEKQAIFAFQGASLENFLRFQKQYRGVKVINLTDNYRSSQQILDSAHSLLAGETKLRAKNQTVAGLKHKVKVAEFSDYKEELLWLAEDIKKRISAGCHPDSLAVFYRQNKNLFAIKDIFDKYEIPYKVFSKENILDNKDIEKLIIFLRAMAEPYENEYLAKLLFVDFLNLDIFDVMKILRRLQFRRGKQRKERTILDIISSPETLKKMEINRPIELLSLADKLKESQKKSAQVDFLEFFEWFARESGFLKYILQKPDSSAGLKRLEKLFDEIRKQFFSQGDYNLSDFLEYIDILKKYNLTIDLGRDNHSAGVNLMTAHGSKGLEFDTVYITNFTDFVWPGRKRGQAFKLPISKQAGEVEDEKRLFYVALTRGKKEVLISYSRLDLEGREQTPSRFLTAFPEKLIEKIKAPTTETRKKINKLFQPPRRPVLSVFSPEYVRAEFLKRTLSVSALNNYFQSPLKYFFRNLLQLPSQPNKNMIFGNIIHQALEDFFKECQRTGKVMSEKKLLQYFQQSLTNTLVPTKYYSDIAKRGQALLQEYYQNYSASFNLDIQLEKNFSTTFKLFNGENLRLYGIIDKIERLPNNKIRVVDYKTGRTYQEKTKEEKEALRRQLVFYKLLLDRHYAETGHPEIKVSEGVLDFVEKSKKTGRFERREFSLSSAEVKELEEQIQDFARDILSGDFLQRKYERDKHSEEFLDLWNLRE